VENQKKATPTPPTTSTTPDSLNHHAPTIQQSQRFSKRLFNPEFTMSIRKNGYTLLLQPLDFHIQHTPNTVTAFHMLKSRIDGRQ
jgi:hypothetical protein